MPNQTGLRDNLKTGTNATQLVENAVESIKKTFGRRAASHLFAGREAKLPGASEKPDSAADFELVTWLVIEDPAESTSDS